MMLKAPVIGPIMVKAAIARYSRTLSTMFAAGVPLVEALTSVAGATGNIVYEDATLRIRDEVSTGQRLQRCMEATGLFPNMVIQMIAVGEESGSLDQMASKVADFYEADVDAAVDGDEQLARTADHGDPRRAGRRPGHRHVPADLQAGRGGLTALAEILHADARGLGRGRLRLQPAGRQLPQRRHPSRSSHAGARVARAGRADPARDRRQMSGRSPTCRPTQRYNLVVPRSACPKCGALITAAQNIPVVSYLLLKGKCAKLRREASRCAIRWSSSALRFSPRWSPGSSASSGTRPRRCCSPGC